MNINRLHETQSIDPNETTNHFLLVPPSLPVMLHDLELDSLFSPLKKRGIETDVLVEAQISYKLTENFSIKHFHSRFMDPERRKFYHLDKFSERTIYRLPEILGENFDYLISGLQDRIFSRYAIDTTDVNMDWTSIVLHGLSSPLGKYGYSRDHRPDKHQITRGITELAKPTIFP